MLAVHDCHYQPIFGRHEITYSFYMVFLLLFSILLLVPLHAAEASGDDLVLSPTEIAQETAWLDSLGVKGTPVVAHPFSFPLSHRSFILPLSDRKSVG